MSTFSFEDKEVHFTEKGDGAPLLLIAGLGGNLSFWKGIVGPLSTQFKVICFDHPGCGKSPKADAQINIDYLARLCLGLLDHLNIETAHLVGHSMGGIIAQTLAIDSPERVGKLVLSSTWMQPDYYFEKSFAQRVSILRELGIEAYVSATALLTIAPRRMILESESVQSWEARSVAGSGSVDVVQDRIKALLAFDRSEELDKISNETMVICYKDDQIVPPHMSKTLADSIAGASYVELARGGHFGPSYFFDEYLKPVLNYLSPQGECPQNARVPQQILMIGCGAIGRCVLEHVQDSSDLIVSAVLVSPGREDHYRDLLGPNIAVASKFEDLDSASYSYAIECGGHSAVQAHGADILEAGIDLGLLSVGALADADLSAKLGAAALKSRAKLELLSGAVGGLEAIHALSQSKLSQVTLRSYKAPGAWKGTAAEDQLDLTQVSKATRFFSGSAKDAATQFPKNANVAASVAFAGLGLDATQVELFADPETTVNRHEISAKGDFGAVEISIMGGTLPGNPKSSGLAALSAVSAIKRRRHGIT